MRPHSRSTPSAANQIRGDTAKNSVCDECRCSRAVGGNERRPSKLFSCLRSGDRRAVARGWASLTENLKGDEVSLSSAQRLLVHRWPGVTLLLPVDLCRTTHAVPRRIARVARLTQEHAPRSALLRAAG